jgi:hypothetical protein
MPKLHPAGTCVSHDVLVLLNFVAVCASTMTLGNIEEAARWLPGLSGQPILFPFSSHHNAHSPITWAAISAKSAARRLLAPSFMVLREAAAGAPALFAAGAAGAMLGVAAAAAPALAAGVGAAAGALALAGAGAGGPPSRRHGFIASVFAGNGGGPLSHAARSNCLRLLWSTAYILFAFPHFTLAGMTPAGLRGFCDLVSALRAAAC